MYRILAAWIMMSLTIFVWAEDGPKYQRGDCITPVAESYSWYGKYATVEAYSSVEGLSEKKSYILAFPFSGSTSTIFEKEIESVTKKVKPSFCGK